MKKSFLIFFCILAGISAGAADIFEFTPRIGSVTDSSFTVLFKTTRKSLCWLEVADMDGTNWYRSERSRYFEDICGRHFYGYYHHIEVKGLKPGTTYRYRVYGRDVLDDSDPYGMTYGRTYAWRPSWGRGEGNAPHLEVRTLDSRADTCRFSMVNDTHYNDARLANLLKRAPAADDFLVFNGDIASYCSSIDSVLKHTFGPVRELVSERPVFYARGNHEGRGGEWYRMPDEFPTPTGRFYYMFRQGPVAFVVLDAGEDKTDSSIEYSGTAAYDLYREEELRWLEAAVKDPSFVSAPWKVCVMHIPTLSDADSWYSQQWISDNFTPVLNRAGLDLMLSGHHHRFIFSKAGENGADYNILVNSNTERLDFEATSSRLELRTFDESGARTREKRFVK